MKLAEIKILETMRLGKIPQYAIDGIFAHLDKEGVHTGDQDAKPIIRAEYNSNVLLGIMNNDGLTSFITFKKEIDANGFNELGVIYTKPEYRNMKDAHRLLWFAKDQDKIAFISSGVQSEDGHTLMRSLAKSKRFDMHWLNDDTNEKREYVEAEDVYPSEYRKLDTKTGWRIIIEAAHAPLFESRYVDFVKNVWCVFEDHRDIPS